MKRGTGSNFLVYMTYASSCDLAFKIDNLCTAIHAVESRKGIQPWINSEVKQGFSVNQATNLRDVIMLKGLWHGRMQTYFWSCVPHP